ncbi:Antibiotic biosynthesis monooxygenase [Thermaerobacter marianensis DSM 12885]|uniref:Antibiotic biosynthesis monooxygenase n=1 Tax=Thermaerobacter marianensis (strain ATCC 700841 / DSM 12885 / JCM 10246 / 7p75a) TaxID=644966 RepID=E6SIA3_THEM7|nr:putative quinol monooxygenase [Thermaerobacter marianensis]ADU51914.1 Antibiotic biosynthesis monooxygenase [Thermaerobacter marianensis DSM 12885]
MIALIARYVTRPGLGDQVEAAIREMILLSRQEPGCRVYQVNRSVDNPDEFLLYEVYDDEGALKAHWQSPHFRRIIEETVVPLLERRERRFYRLVEP